MGARAEVALVILAAAARVACITVAPGVAGRKHVHGAVDPDEYLWAKLPGRCCFEMKEVCPYEDAPRSQCRRTPPDTCRECSVWSTPENYCHSSRDNCLSCGMSLYCASPPPLLDGNKVCKEESRVGTGCYDDMATGMCASKTEMDCEAECRANPDCELFVYYPEEMKGSCVLCSDLFNHDTTPETATRAYAVLEARLPPLPPGAIAPSQFAVIADSPSPSPPKLAAAPPSPKVVHSTLGRHKAGKSNAHVDCTFEQGVEYTSTRQSGYSDRVAATKEECCQMCGHLEAGCSHFVFEASSGICVLLPVIGSANELETDDNEFVVSGKASVGDVATGAETFDVSKCSMTPNAGYSSGSIGAARKLPGGVMRNSNDCCRSCGVTPECTKFVFSENSKECTMYASYAEMVMINDLTAGEIPSKQTGFTMDESDPESAGTPQGNHLFLFPPSPGLPSFARLVLSPPPPPPSRREDSRLESFIRDISLGISGAIAFGVLMSIYCFFSPQLLSCLHSASGGRVGKVHVRAQKVSRVDEDEERFLSMGMDGEDEPRRHSRKSRRPRRVTTPPPEMDGMARDARLMVQTPEITQSRDVCVADCEDLEDLRSVFFEEFHSVLKGVRHAQTQLFCLAPADATDQANAAPQMMWFLVTKHSDFRQVVQCPAFRLQDKRCDENQSGTFAVAFVATGREVGSDRKKKSRPKRQKQLLLGYNPSGMPSESTSCNMPVGTTPPPEPKRHGEARRARRKGRMKSAASNCSGDSDHGLSCDSGGASDRSDSSSSKRQSRKASALHAVAPPPDSAVVAPMGALPPMQPQTACAYAQHFCPLPLTPPLPPPPASHAFDGATQERALPPFNPPKTTTSGVPPLQPPQYVSLAGLSAQQLNTALPSCNVPPPRAARSAVNAWDDDDAARAEHMTRSRRYAASMIDELLE